MTKKPIFGVLSIAAFLLLLTACTIPSAKERTLQAVQLVSATGWNEIRLQTEYFDLTGFTPISSQDQHNLLTVYIEGDGLAWLTRNRISPNPTPVNPIALKLAIRHPSSAVVYLARPCQYSKNQNCNNRFWTSARFSPDVVTSYLQALDQLKLRHSVEKFELIGFSGGGAIAALVAAKRDDVVRLITVAGNLDHRAWTDQHRVSPLTDSLNPADFHSQLKKTRQIHFVGSQDSVMPLAIAKAYADRFPSNFQPEIRLVDTTSHNCCWEQRWLELYPNNISSD